jgi:hypothetical protein
LLSNRQAYQQDLFTFFRVLNEHQFSTFTLLLLAFKTLLHNLAKQLRHSMDLYFSLRYQTYDILASLFRRSEVAFA